jgi:hypothetical protein
MTNKKPFVKINIEDLEYAKEFFDNIADYSIWLYAVTEYYQGNEVTIKKKIVKKYFDNYKKTMNIVIEAKEFGKKGALKRIENQQDNIDTLEDPLKETLEETLVVNNKDKDKDKLNIVPFQERVNGFLNWFNSEFVKHGKQQAKFRTLNNQTESNLKKLLDKYSTDEWNYAFENMIKSEWVIESKNATPDHFLRPANFEKYVNQPKPQEEKFNLPHLR